MKKTLIELLTGAGLVGAILFADTLDSSLRDFLVCEIPCFTLLLGGTFLLNRKTAETEAPAANTMKRGESRNS